MTSASGSLNPTGWNSFEDQGVAGWLEGGAADASSLAEANLTASSSLAPSETLSLGGAYDTGVDAQDVAFTYVTPSGILLEGAVEYVSSPFLLGDVNLDTVVNGLDVDPFDRDVPSEFIELHNAGATAADLTDWSFSDGVDFSFAAGTTLDPDDYLVIAQDLDAYNAVYGGGPSEEVVAYEVSAGTSGLQNFGGSLGMDFVVDRPIRVTALGVFDSDGNGLNRTITAQLWSRSDRGTPSNPNDDSGVGILSSEVFTRHLRHRCDAFAAGIPPACQRSGCREESVQLRLQ